MRGIEIQYRKIILFTISLAVISLIAVSPALAAVGEYLTIVDSQTTVTENSLGAVITTAANIPTDGVTSLFGYAVATGSLTNNVFVLETHLPIEDSPFADSVSGFHGHILDLRAVDPTDTADVCAGMDAEIDTINSQANLAYDMRTPYNIQDNNINIIHVDTDYLNSGIVSDVIAFDIIPLPSENDPQHLCIDFIGNEAGQ